MMWGGVVRRCWLLVLGCVVLLVGVFGVGVGCAFGAGPVWVVSSVASPSFFAPGGDVGGDAFVVLVTNGGGVASGGVVSVTDELPVGVEALGGVVAEDLLVRETGGLPSFSSSCVRDGEERKVSCTYSGVVQPDDTLLLSFPVRVVGVPPVSCKGLVVAPAVGCVGNVVRVSGGGAVAPGVMETEVLVSPEKAGFGIAAGGAAAVLSSVQAGAHPDLTTTFAVNTENREGLTSGNLKDVSFDLPPGFAGDLVDTPVCSAVDFLEEACPVSTQVGVTTVTIIGPTAGPHLQPVYNLAAEPGEVAKLGFAVASFHYEGDVKVREPGEPGIQPVGGAGEAYGLRTTFSNATAGKNEVDNVALTVWGVPASPVHDALRNTCVGCLTPSFGGSSNASPAAYLTNPTSCSPGGLGAAFRVTSWQAPLESENPSSTYVGLGSLVGCDALVMEPSLTAEVSSDSAGSATGLDVATKIPQTYGNAFGVATPALKREVVTLPEGMTVNPSSGAGLQACSEAQFAEEETQELSGEAKSAGHGCPVSSKLATVRIKTPSIAEEVSGSLFLATPAPRGALEPGNNPFDALLAVYLVARAGERGVLIKAAGVVAADEATGRLTTTFDDLPPLPFSLATFSFNQGANAPLVTPAECGDFTVTAELTPWSAPEGAPLIPEIPPFPITQNCPAGGVPPFAPQVTAGTLNNAAGSYSPLTIRITRNDNEQEITGFSTQFPAGLTGNLSGVAECSEANVQTARKQTGIEAENSPACPANSEIGHSIAEAGVGSVLAQAPGKIYLGGPYNGSGACTAGSPGCAPFSVVAITSAHVGPFDLGTVVIHFPLEINPETAAVSIPAGPADQIPHIIKGIVIHVRNIHAYISRKDFMLNPTGCDPTKLSATVIGGGQNPVNPAGYDRVTVTDPFQAADCPSLKFEPKFAVSTQAKTSKALGASLHVDLTYPTGALTQDTNIKQVKVELPKALPSRLTTLQKACTAAQFASNPAGCPPESLIGTAKALTPILPVALEGPVYFVSHGGEAFPSLIMVLQGDGVTIDLVGTTFISKSGITSSTFKTIPDQPVSSFELELPEKPFSALAANGNLCTQKLVMPTEFIGQNGAPINRSTPVTVTGCKPAITVTKHSVKGRTAYITVSVPAAGKLTATAKGLSKATTKATKASTVTVKLTLTKAETAVLKKHKTHKLKAKITLKFTPTHGSKLTTTVTVLVGG